MTAIVAVLAVTALGVAAAVTVYSVHTLSSANRRLFHGWEVAVRRESVATEQLRAVTARPGLPSDLRIEAELALHRLDNDHTLR